MSKNLLNRIVWIAIPLTMLAALAMVALRPDINLQFSDKVFIIVTAINSTMYLSSLIKE